MAGYNSSSPAGRRDIGGWQVPRQDGQKALRATDALIAEKRAALVAAIRELQARQAQAPGGPDPEMLEAMTNEAVGESEGTAENAAESLDRNLNTGPAYEKMFPAIGHRDPQTGAVGNLPSVSDAIAAYIRAQQEGGPQAGPRMAMDQSMSAQDWLRNAASKGRMTELRSEATRDELAKTRKPPEAKRVAQVGRPKKELGDDSR